MELQKQVLELVRFESDPPLECHSAIRPSARPARPLLIGHPRTVLHQEVARGPHTHKGRPPSIGPPTCDAVVAEEAVHT